MAHELLAAPDQARTPLTALPADMVRFQLDRERQLPLLKDNFGWPKGIYLKQAAAVLFAIQPDTPLSAHLDGILSQLAASYPKISPIFMPENETRLPADFFLASLQLLLPSADIPHIANGIKQLDLTPIDYATALLLLRGLSHQQIAQSLNIAFKTVEKHHSNLSEKVRRAHPAISSLPQLAILFRDYNLLPPQLLADFTSQPLDPSPLTPRELEVLSFIGQGLTNPQIAYQLQIALTTAGKHIFNIQRKTDIHSKDRLGITWALQNMPPPQAYSR